jgi:DegV family protein with EDD domain
MKFVTDSGVNMNLTPQELKELNINVVPLRVTLEGTTYREGEDITNDDFYHLLASTRDLPKTTQPSPGEIAEVYRHLASTDPEILSIHMSSGLSGTYQSAVLASQLVPEARVTHVDTKTLSSPSGWQVEAAARAAQAGWSIDKILDMLKAIKAATETLFTLDELKYLIHGGRISHMKGLIASVLNIKPIIGVEKENGTYVQVAFMRSFQKALKGLVDIIERRHPAGSELKIEVVHANNLEWAERLQQMVAERFSFKQLPCKTMSIVLGAHTGPSMIGIAYAGASAFKEFPL